MSSGHSLLTSMVSQYLAAPGGLHITTHYTAALLLHHHDHDRSPNRSPAVSESGLRALARKPCHLPELLQIRTHGPNASWGRSRSQSRQSNNPLKSLLPRPSHVREARKSRERAEREREWPWPAVALEALRARVSKFRPSASTPEREIPARAPVRRDSLGRGLRTRC